MKKLQLSAAGWIKFNQRVYANFSKQYKRYRDTLSLHPQQTRCNTALLSVSPILILRQWVRKWTSLFYALSRHFCIQDGFAITLHATHRPCSMHFLSRQMSIVNLQDLVPFPEKTFLALNGRGGTTAYRLIFHFRFHHIFDLTQIWITI